MEQEIEQRFNRIEAILATTADAVKASADLIFANTGAIQQITVRLESLVEAQAETTNKLNALIHVVDNWISERGKGEK